MTIKRARGAKAKCDQLFSLIVRARGECENCGDRRYPVLQTAHVISRRYSATRCDLRNAFCLCAKCHRYFTDYPVDFAAFVEQKLGDTYDELRRLARQSPKVDWDRELERLRAVWLEIEARISP